jgi:hypothetical protein
VANIYEKLQTVRVSLQGMDLKKTGENKFVGYKYYDLADVLPAINKLMLEHKMTSALSYGTELATLRVINIEKPEEVIEFTSPMSTAALKGAHEVQNLGAVETYIRRYLYITAFEIVEADALDKSQGSDDEGREQKKPAKKRSTEDTGAENSESGDVCSTADCKAEISPAVAKFSKMKFKKPLCMECQKKQ